MSREPGKRSAESGYAMLLVFLMAATIGIMLFMQLPRVAFESQRNKEQLLIERGEQYQRAIQVFFRKNKRYPATLEELESLNNVRYLRKKYVDPMTGKAEWRLIHVGPGGVFTDSKINKQKKDGKGASNANAFVAELPSLGTTTGNETQNINPALRRRPSDTAGAQGQPGGAPDQSGMYPGQPGQPGQPGMYPGQPGMYPGQVPGQPGTGPTGPPTAPVGFGGAQPVYNDYGQLIYTPGQVSNTGAYAVQPQPGQPGMSVPGTYPAPAVNSQTGGMSPSPSPYSTQPGAFNQGGGAFNQGGGAFNQGGGAFNQGGGAFNQGGGAFNQGGGAFNQGGGNAGMNDATKMIQNLLTTPRAGGFPGAAGGGMGGATMGGGIAGVASNAEQSAIKIYNERDKYDEWEFIYDPTKDKSQNIAMGQAGTIGTPAQQMGSMPGQGGQSGSFGGGMSSQGGFGQPGGPGQSSGFGQPGGFGQSSGFGQPGGFGQSGQASGFGQSSQSGSGGFLGGQSSLFGSSSGSGQQTPGAGQQPGMQPGQQPGYGQQPGMQPGQQPGYTQPVAPPRTNGPRSTTAPQQ